MQPEMDEKLSRIVAKIDNISVQLDEISRRLDNHIGKCEQEAEVPVVEMENKAVGIPSKGKKIGRYRCSKEENQAESLRKSLQENIVLIVENVSFEASSLPDMLISNNCLSENETEEIRKLTNEKDQIRNMIRLLKGRSFEVMNAFLNCLKHECPHVANRISATFEKRVWEYNAKPACGYCQLKRSVDLKFLADHVWSIGALEDSEYDEIVMGNCSQNELWELFAKGCNRSERITKVMDKLVSALKQKGVYCKCLVSKLETLSELKCTCRDDRLTLTIGGQCLKTNVAIDVDQCSTTTTVSPTSSTYTGNGDASRNVSDMESEDEPIPLCDPANLFRTFFPENSASNPLNVTRNTTVPIITIEDVDDVCYRRTYGVRKPLKHDADSNLLGSDLVLRLPRKPRSGSAGFYINDDNAQVLYRARTHSAFC